MAAITPPNTVTQLSHAITIRANQVVIGAINGWNPRMTQGVTELYELNNDVNSLTPGGGPIGVTNYSTRSGEPFEKVPGNVSGMTIEVQRYDIYTTQMEEAFGTPLLTMLSNQRNAFHVTETWTRPDNTNYTEQYSGCWFSNLGRTIQSTGDRIVSVSATLEYTHRSRL